MNEPKDGYQSAMPYVLAPREDENGVMQRFEPGMTLRDWFAGQALCGYLAQDDGRTCPSDIVKQGDQAIEAWRSQIRSSDAKWCYAMADAMIEARKQ